MEGKTIEKIEYGSDGDNDLLILTMTDGSTYTISSGSSYSCGVLSVQKDMKKPKYWTPEILNIEGE